MMRSSANRSGALRLLAFVALASLGRVAMAQDICACKGACEFVLGSNICYVAGGVSCGRATRTLFPPWTDAWIPCPDSSGGPIVSGPPEGSANSVPGRPATSIPGGSADGRDCKGNFGPEKCVAARNPSFPGEKELCAMYTIVTPEYRNGAPCPHADGYKQCREGNSRECNKPVYDEVEETECERLSFTESVNVGPFVISNGQISEPGATKCEVDVLARVTKWGEDTANIKSISTSNAKQAIDKFTASKTTKAGMVSVGLGYEKGSSEQSSKTVEYEGFKWLVSPENCVAEVDECYGCKEKRTGLFGIGNNGCRVKGRVSGSGRCDFKFTTLGEVCVDVKKRVCVENCDVESNSGATASSGATSFRGSR